MSASAPRWPNGDPDAVAKAVLAQPAFRATVRTSDVAPQKSVLQLIWDFFYQHVLSPIIHPIGKAIESSHWAGALVGYLLVAIALVALAFLIVRLVLAFAVRDGGRRRSNSASTALDERPNMAAWLARARARAAAGDYAAAIAALFSAALAKLDAGPILFDAARTPGEYKRLLRRFYQRDVPSFDELAERFVRAAYAAGISERTDYENAERAFVAFEGLS